MADRKTCAQCSIRHECTRSNSGRSVARHWKEDWIEVAHAFAQRPEAQADRRRRRYLMEGSFAHAANCYHFKRSRWRRLWRQQIQDGIIAAVQNIAMLCGAQAAKVPVAPPKPPRSRSVRSDPLLVAPYCRSKMATRAATPEEHALPDERLAA